MTDNIRETAKPLSGKHSVHVNSIYTDGGVAEALWKETPVVARKVGGIPLQNRNNEWQFIPVMEKYAIKKHCQKACKMVEWD